uniref:Zinc ribbon domain-containing protein n=1 Tax=uncultured Caudovirales phage TaxID=2100421 RepID=A0A6J5L2E0_9CAUD|nr:hypothetical protein UFOVP114_64 [uncultured Caudovirales phage]
MGFAFAWLLCGIIAAVIGARKGEGILAFVVGCLFGPLGILVTLFSKGNRKTCSACRELIHKHAAICPRCRTHA